MRPFTQKILNAKSGASEQTGYLVVFLPVVGGIILIAGLCLWIGYAIGQGGNWIASEIQILNSHWHSLRNYGRWAPEGLYMPAPAAPSEAAVLVHRPERWLAGYRAVMGWDDQARHYTIWLLDEAGVLVHRWKVHYPDYDPDTKLAEHVNPHGMALLSDGSVLLNFGVGGQRLVKIDQCSQVSWARQGKYHHSIEVTEDGSLWTWLAAGELRSGPEQIMVKLDVRDGSTLEKIELRDVMRRSDAAAAVIAGVGTDQVFADSEDGKAGLAQVGDIFHPNDVEALPASLASAYPAFEAGDLLISLRNRDLVVVMGMADREIKWWRHGPWVRQHDPDYGPDGKIYVFNNNPARKRSTVVAIEPSSASLAESAADSTLQEDRVSQFFADRSTTHFYTKAQGKLQVLSDEQVLVVVPAEGRVIEADQGGATVFEYHNRVSDGINARILNASWLPLDFFDDGVPHCTL